MVKIRMNNGMEAEMSIEEFKEWSGSETEKVEMSQKINRVIKINQPIKKAKTHQPWSKDDDKTLREMFQKRKSDKYIAKHLGRTVYGINNRRKILRIIHFYRRSPKKRTVSPNDGRIKMMNYVNNEFLKLRKKYPSVDSQRLRKVAMQNYRTKPN